MSETTFAKGLEGVIAAESKICLIKGEEGLLSYRGYEIENLAMNSSFGESAWLLLFGELPTREELEGFKKRLASARKLDPSILGVLRSLPKDTHPMIALQAAVAAHGALSPVPGGKSQENVERALDLIARFPTIVAAWARLRDGNEPVEPREDLGHGQNFLYMLNNEVPDEETGHIFDVCLILHMEHSFNASTFAGRVIASTLAPLDAAISGAVGALYGPLHGGANEGVLKMLEEVPEPAKVREWLDDALARKYKIMGMGHRVYKSKDPRSFVLEGHLKRLSEKTGNDWNYSRLKAIENNFREIVEAQGRKIYPNVDFFAGSLYTVLGIQVIDFTPIFAIARVVGWAAHILEQWEDNRIFRPECLYTGPETRQWVPFEAR